MDFSSDYTQIWTAEAEPGAADDVGSSRTVTEVDGPQQAGPLTTAIEGTQWTRADIELAVEVLNGVLLLLTLYAVFADGEGL
ncbi:hypothetical protein [Haloarcula onubensis]|uniref:Uncharacterized protein n=1 Tax=Haloarcula onubensis TaxID=2950539 RepID=A0ABU2FIP0_9EURY|nr:hypothetical protein [Halomicroarcula sp. S3CR25-11]MDS0280629.1 hypothetical protein [Halomicroarcula sp. S3CR25-11]